MLREEQHCYSLAYLRSEGRVQALTLRQALGVSKDTQCRDLRDLATAGNASAHLSGAASPRQKRPCETVSENPFGNSFSMTRRRRGAEKTQRKRREMAAFLIVFPLRISASLRLSVGVGNIQTASEIN
jgi:DeoR/GlpR family transcriptional regulator of sugar metabolism